jgi:GNAT superfamily N-acetyltransferase
MPDILQSLEGVVVRPALASDKAAVLQFCQQTWPDIEDYIASVWDKWMADVSGQILVALLKERPVAMARVVRLSDIEGWWEGLRVDPQYRGRGLVSVLESAVKQYFREVGVEVIRSCVAKWNTIMHGIMQRRGYQQVGCYLLHRADAVQAPVEQIGKLTGDDAEAVWSFLNSQDGSLRERLFVSRGAKWQTLATFQLRERLSAGLFWGYRQGESLQSLLIQSYMESADTSLWVGYIDGTLEGLPVLLQEMRCLAHQQDYPSVGGFFPKTDLMLGCLTIAGYHPSPQEEFLVYEAAC